MERRALSAHISNPNKHHQATHQNVVNRRLRNALTPGPSCSTPSLDSETADQAPKRLNSLQMWMSATMCNPFAFMAYAQPKEPASTRSSRCSSRRGISQAPSRSKLEASRHSARPACGQRRHRQLGGVVAGQSLSSATRSHPKPPP